MLTLGVSWYGVHDRVNRPAQSPEERAVAALDRLTATLPPPRLASAEQYPATVVLLACTATRVGPRHYLTAAHCFGDPLTLAVKEVVAPGFPITIASAPDATQIEQAVIEAVWVHPQYRFDFDAALRSGVYSPDVAVLAVDRELAGPAIARIAAVPVRLEQSVTLVGTRAPADAGLGARRRKGIPARTVAADPYPMLDFSKFIGPYVLMAGPAPEHAAWAIDYGDSGGATYLTHAGREYVVGVHSIVLSKTTVDVRLDDSYGVASWLESVGVVVTRE